MCIMSCILFFHLQAYDQMILEIAEKKGKDKEK